MGITESLVLSERAHFFRPAPNPPPELGALIQRAEQYLIVNRSFSGHFRSVRLPGFGIGFVPYPLSFPKGLKIFPRSGSVTPLSRSLPADQKCGRCYLRIPRRRCSFRRVQRLPRLRPRLRGGASIHFRWPPTSSISRPGGRPKFCDAKLNLRSRGGGCLVDEVDARRGGSLQDVFASPRPPRVIFDCDRRRNTREASTGPSPSPLCYRDHLKPLS